MSGLQVYHERQIVGILRHVDPAIVRVPWYEFRVMDLEELRIPSSAPDDAGLLEHMVYRIPISRRRHKTSLIEVKACGEEAIRRNARIPSYASANIDHVSELLLFEWYVTQVDLETYEFLFDLAMFDPIGKPCEASQSEERWWRYHEPVSMWDKLRPLTAP